VLKKQKQKKGTSKNQLNPVGAAVSEARPAEAGITITNPPPFSDFLEKRRGGLVIEANNFSFVF